MTPSKVAPRWVRDYLVPVVIVVLFVIILGLAGTIIEGPGIP